MIKVAASPGRMKCFTAYFIVHEDCFVTVQELSVMSDDLHHYSCHGIENVQVSIFSYAVAVRTDVGNADRNNSSCQEISYRH